MTNQFSVSHSWATAGVYAVVLWAYNDACPNGVSATVIVQVADLPTRYVSSSNPNPVAPYLSWSTAATNIQDAIDVADPGDEVLVTNGVYQTGGRVVYGLLTNRVALTKALAVQSVNGPAVTLIEGYQMPDTTNGDSAVRCAYLTNGATLAGFTLTGGATASSGDWGTDVSGGGVWSESATTLISNCVITGNASANHGGGADNGTLNNCVLSCNNTLGNGGGAYSSTLNNCTLSCNSAPGFGGGADLGTLNNCTVVGNLAGYAGGTYYGTVNNSLIISNCAPTTGGAYRSVMNNCTLVGNSAPGAVKCTLRNCIIYYNSAPDIVSGSVNYCCTPVPGGFGNITAEPLLTPSFHLSVGSPCRGAGSADYATGVDIDGEPWANPPSIGCDEYNPLGHTGPLSVAIQASSTNTAVGLALSFGAVVTGDAEDVRWSFGDGVIVSNLFSSHVWAAAGDYTLTLAVYNDTYPGGVSATTVIHVADELGGRCRYGKP